MRYIYSCIWMFLKKSLRVVFGENKVRGAIVFVLLAGLLTAATVAGLKSFPRNTEDIIAEDPIESYDNVVEIIIDVDGAVVDTQETEETESETVGG